MSDESITLTAREAAIVRDAVAVATVILEALPRPLRDEYQPAAMEALLLRRLDGRNALTGAQLNIACELADMGFRRFRKMRDRAIDYAESDGLIV